MKKHIIPGLLIIFLLFSCSNDKKEQKEEQISVRTTANETDMDSVANSIKENMTFSQLASNPNSVILTGLKEHRLVSVYKSRGNDISFDENIGYSSTSVVVDGQLIEVDKPFMPGIEILYGYNLLNIAHYNMETEKMNFLFQRPVLIKTLYYPSFIEDSLNKIPIKRNYFLVTVYDDDSNKDSLINKRDLRRMYYFNADCNVKIRLIPTDYSVIRSQYDPQNDAMYIFARKDENKNGISDKTEPIHIYWLDMKVPVKAKRLY